MTITLRRLALPILAISLTSELFPSAQAAEPELPNDATIYSWINDIVGFGVRMPGTEASRQAAQYIHDHFVASGLENVGFETADSLTWNADHFRLSVNGEELPSSPMLHTLHQGTPGPFSTPADGLEAELEYVGSGSAYKYWFRDVKGKIVVADVGFGRYPLWLFRPLLLDLQDSASTFGSNYNLTDPYSGGDFPESYYRAMERGAAGFIGVLTDYFDSHQYRNEAYDSYDPGRAMQIPGAWLSPVEGEALIKQIQARRFGFRPLKATLEMEGQLSLEQARGVIGYLPGQTDEIILVQSHHDSATPGATEDASGTAVVLALARYFAQVPLSQRRRTLLFATMDSHFTDYAQHKAFSRRHIHPDNPLGENILAAVTVEHIAQEVVVGQNRQPTPTGLVAPRILMVSTEVDGFKEIARDILQVHGLERTAAVATSVLQFVSGGGIPADSSEFLREGLPVFALVGAPLYLYDAEDTLDKVAVNELERVTGAFAEVIHRMDALPSENFKRLPLRRD